MSDVQNQVNAPDEEATPTLAEQTIAQLKRKADLLGVQYKSNVSVATLQRLIQEQMEAPTGAEESTADQTVNYAEAASVGAVSAETKSATDVYNEAMKLVRVIITPMEATKAANMESDVFCAGNAVVGTVKRTIPFGVEWHVEQILLNAIKEKKYQAFQVKKNARNVDVTSSRLVPAYGINYLDPLTKEELAALADRQLRTRALEDE